MFFQTEITEVDCLWVWQKNLICGKIPWKINAKESFENLLKINSCIEIFQKFPKIIFLGFFCKTGICRKHVLSFAPEQQVWIYWRELFFKLLNHPVGVKLMLHTRFICLFNLFFLFFSTLRFLTFYFSFQKVSCHKNFFWPNFSFELDLLKI